MDELLDALINDPTFMSVQRYMQAEGIDSFEKVNFDHFISWITENS